MVIGYSDASYAASGISHPHEADMSLCLARLHGNPDTAAYTFGRENEVNGSAKLVRDELAYEASAVPRLSRSDGQRSGSLTPFDYQTRRCIVAGPVVPIH